jgi:hypothetical protein
MIPLKRVERATGSLDMLTETFNPNKTIEERYICLIIIGQA